MGPSSVSVSPALLMYVCRVFLHRMSCNQWPYMKLTAIAKYPSRSCRRLLLLQTCARSHQRITLQSEAQTVRTQPSCLVDLPLVIPSASAIEHTCAPTTFMSWHTPCLPIVSRGQPPHSKAAAAAHADALQGEHPCRKATDAGSTGSQLAQRSRTTRGKEVPRQASATVHIRNFQAVHCKQSLLSPCCGQSYQEQSPW